MAIVLPDAFENLSGKRSVGCSGSGAGCILPRTGRNLRIFRSGRLGTFTLTVDADAYKQELNISTEDWMWDALNFETGIIRDYRGISVSGSSSKLLEGSGIPVVPVFYVNNLDESASNYITFNGTRYTLQQGRNRFADLVIPVSGGRLYFYGTYTVSIEFRGGSL